jgi:DNA-binding response OmpR family regulator
MRMKNKGTILLVDNDLYLNNISQNEFYRRDYAVLTATTYRDARQILNKTEPDVIIMEMALPDGNGLEFFEEITGQTTASVIFLTSQSACCDMISGIKLGCDEYISKPFSKDVMVARVEAVMRRRIMEVSR